ncbi:hypothetical protein PSMK_12330 [Phycisphaera mikurensis NBRC 102666]|uniref:Uncharacterized protein n=1 Tax=Phycisphaera mikurensis (strain NBRC 102666 / KCTC 22515 / FYK2301M01) TaxID=1142394 RepID=I0IDQ4_PHYMF|nr:hypothetical protein PSMK_12330 [Phycisphaera mikurensis NBRC 102666]
MPRRAPARRAAGAGRRVRIARHCSRQRRATRPPGCGDDRSGRMPP